MAFVISSIASMIARDDVLPVLKPYWLSENRLCLVMKESSLHFFKNALTELWDVLVILYMWNYPWKSELCHRIKTVVLGLHHRWPDLLETFKSLIKTHLFKEVFPWSIPAILFNFFLPFFFCYAVKRLQGIEAV